MTQASSHLVNGGGGRWGRSAPGSTFRGGKIEGIAKKNWEGEKHLIWRVKS